MLTQILRRKGHVQLRASAIRGPDGHVIERHYIVAVDVQGVYGGSDLNAATAAFEKAASENLPRS